MWTFGGVRIFAQDEKDSSSRIIPRLQPLNSGTILQSFGWEDTTKTLTALVVGNTDKEAIQAFIPSGVSQELVNYDGTIGDFFLKDVSFAIEAATSMQTLRTDLDCYSPVYTTTLELYEDI